MNKKVIISLLSLSALCSCTDIIGEGVTTPSTDPVEISFSSSIASKVADGAFELNDEITVSAANGTTAYATNVSYIYNGSIFTSQTPITQIVDDLKLSYTAVYPADSTRTDQFAFEIKSDQSADDNYELSDLLVAEVEATSEICPKLAFDHKFVNIVLNITTSGKNGGSMTMVAKNNVSCTISTNSYTATGESATITPATYGTTGFTVILAPQTIAKGSTIATYVYEGISYSWVASSDITLQSGYKYTYNWSLADREVTLESEINGWGDGGTYNVEGE